MARIKYWDEASQSWKYADKSLKIDSNFLIDKDLIIEGRAADAKATGDAITAARTHAEEVANEAASNVKNDLLNGAGAAYDTLKEVGALIEENKEAIEALETIASIQADWTQSDVNAKDYIKNKPSLENYVTNSQLSSLQAEVAQKAQVQIITWGADD